jgi:hypothetical protein
MRIVSLNLVNPKNDRLRTQYLTHAFINFSSTQWLTATNKGGKRNKTQYEIAGISVFTSAKHNHEGFTGTKSGESSWFFVGKGKRNVYKLHTGFAGSAALASVRSPKPLRTAHG